MTSSKLSYVSKYEPCTMINEMDSRENNLTMNIDRIIRFITPV